MTDHWPEHWLVTARFEPKNKTTLRECYWQIIGRVFEMEWVGTSNDDEPYPGQWRWIISRKHYPEIPDECKGRWMPQEDIVIIAPSYD